MDTVYREQKTQNRSVLLDNRDGMSEDRLSGGVDHESVFPACVRACVCAGITAYRGRAGFLAAQRQTCVIFHQLYIINATEARKKKNP